MLLLAGIAFVLVMASVNVANLLLAQKHRARKGAGDARRPGRRPRPPRAAIADREPALRPGRRHRRHDRHELDAARPDCARPRRSAAHERGQRRLARAARRRADDDAHRRAGRAAAGAELGEREPAGQLAGRQPRHGGRHASPPRPRRPRRRGSRAGRRDHHRRRSAAPQLRVGHEREPGLRHVAPPHLADERAAAPDVEPAIDSPSTATSLPASRRSPAWCRSAARRACRWAARRSRPACRSKGVPFRPPSCRKCSSGAPCTTTSPPWAFRSAAAATSIPMTARRRRRSR